ncbi:MAG: hypothetical protein IJP27_10255 [Clostridia bacterium]|nr:hypothetical protein [Clostridia bacterium]
MNEQEFIVEKIRTQYTEKTYTDPDLLNYPICKGILSSRRKKYAAEIVALSDRILNAK